MSALHTKFHSFERTWSDTSLGPRGYLQEPHEFSCGDPKELAEILLEELRKLPISQLKRDVSSLRKTVEDQSRTLEAQGNAIARLQEMIGEAVPPPLDDFDNWIVSEDALKFQNRHIAYVHGKGVIGSADTLDGLTALIAENPLKKEAILDFVCGDRI